MSEPTAATEFVVTKEYRRFREFLDACRRYRYIGLCYGAPGVGKALSAHHYARWAQVAPYLEESGDGGIPPPDLEQLRDTYDRGQLGLVLIGMPGLEKRLARYAQLYSRVGFVHHYRALGVVYTPEVATTPRRIADGVRRLRTGLEWVVDAALHPELPYDYARVRPDRLELLIVDEVDRLKLAGLADCRTAEELRFILERKWAQLGLAFSSDDFTDAEALAAIARITGGNFRLVQRLFAQIERVLEINQLRTITAEVVQVARESLVIGPLG